MVDWEMSAFLEIIALGLWLGNLLVWESQRHHESGTLN